MRVFKHDAKQVHPVPPHAVAPKGPFPRELMREPEIVYATPAYSEDGGDFALGGTAQNNYKPPRFMRCSVCFARVLENETAYHVCEE